MDPLISNRPILTDEIHGGSPWRSRNEPYGK
jgi:hypothetical protein